MPQRNDSARLTPSSAGARVGLGVARRPPAGRGSASAKLIVGVVLGVVLVVGAVLGLRGRGGADDSKPDLYTVARQSFDVTATANGELRARKQTVLRSALENQAAIVEIVPEGSKVAKGDVLCRLNGDEIQKRLDDELLVFESARSDMISAENAYKLQISDNESALRQALLKVELAEIDLKKWEQGDLVAKQLELDLAIDRAQREHGRLKTKLERSEQLFSREFLSSDELDKDRLAFVEAESNLRTAQLAKVVHTQYTEDKDRKKLTSDLDEARAELERTNRKSESELASKEAAMTNKRRQLELREERVAKLRDQLEATVIKAPTDGLVVYATSLNQNMWSSDSSTLDVGRVIYPNQEVIMLPDTQEMIAAIKVQESLLNRVRAGMKSLVTIDAAQGKKYPGTIESIGIMADTGGFRDPNVREYEVKMGLDLGDEPHSLKPSMRCEARLVLASVSDVLTVPVQAVFVDGPLQYVYTSVGGDQYRQTPVRVGRRSDTLAEIVSGLSADEKVILRQPPATRITKASAEAIAAAKPPPGMGSNGMGGRGPGGPPGGQMGRAPGGMPSGMAPPGTPGAPAPGVVPVAGKPDGAARVENTPSPDSEPRRPGGRKPGDGKRPAVEAPAPGTESAAGSQGGPGPNPGAAAPKPSAG